MNWRNLLVLGSCVLTVGCGLLNSRSDFDRDPFVMSHLTHSKGDPAFAGTENAFSLEDDELALGGDSVSRKPLQSVYDHELLTTPGLRTRQRQDALGRADDYAWIVGTLGYREGRRGGWHIRYSAPAGDDRFGGELAFDNHVRLGLLRAGDRVLVEGNVISSVIGGHRYRVDSIHLLEP